MRFMRRKGALLMALAPLLFIFSGLFLANAVLYPPGSLPYVFGQFLCIFVSPALLISGVVVCAVAQKRQPKSVEDMRGRPGERVEKAKAAKPPMPRWERLARRIYALSLFVGLVVLVAGYPRVGTLPTLLVAVFAVPLVMGAYLLSSWRGWFAAVFFLACSLLAFFGAVPSGIISLPGVGIMNTGSDLIDGIGPLGGAAVVLAVRSGIALSASIFLATAWLLQHKKVHVLAKSRFFKAVAIVVILLPFSLMFLITSGEAPADPSVVHPHGTDAYNWHFLVGDLYNPATSRTFDPATGKWTYTIFMSNSGPDNESVLKVWAGREAVEPLGSRITVSGAGIAISDEGIIFEPGASGTLTFTTTQGHNTVALALTGDAGWSYNW
jgi:hypothetical protein